MPAMRIYNLRMNAHELYIPYEVEFMLIRILLLEGKQFTSKPEVEDIISEAIRTMHGDVGVALHQFSVLDCSKLPMVVIQALTSSSIAIRGAMAMFDNFRGKKCQVCVMMHSSSPVQFYKDPEYSLG